MSLCGSGLPFNPAGTKLLPQAHWVCAGSPLSPPLHPRPSLAERTELRWPPARPPAGQTEPARTPTDELVSIRLPFSDQVRFPSRPPPLPGFPPWAGLPGLPGWVRVRVAPPVGSSLRPSGCGEPQTRGRGDGEERAGARRRDCGRSWSSPLAAPWPPVTIPGHFCAHRPGRGYGNQNFSVSLSLLLLLLSSPFRLPHPLPSLRL